MRPGLGPGPFFSSLARALGTQDTKDAPTRSARAPSPSSPQFPQPPAPGPRRPLAEARWAVEEVSFSSAK